jgi:hypothetical protein
VKLTLRQLAVLQSVRKAYVVESGRDLTVLKALERKGLVDRNVQFAPVLRYMQFTWTLTDAGNELAKMIEENN